MMKAGCNGRSFACLPVYIVSPVFLCGHIENFADLRRAVDFARVAVGGGGAARPRWGLRRSGGAGGDRRGRPPPRRRAGRRGGAGGGGGGRGPALLAGPPPPRRRPPRPAGEAKESPSHPWPRV